MSRAEKTKTKKAKASTTHEARMWRDVITPEGAAIRFRLADASERAGALLIDAGIMLIILILGSIGLFALGAGLGREIGSDLAQSLWYLLFLLLRGFYFTMFEMGRRAATPGKRAMRLRVVARDGGQLTANSVFARNVMRELEVFLPFNVLLAGPGGDGLSLLMTLCLVLWLGVFVALPFFNKDKLRAGDMVAGTWVIRDPKLDLKKDVSTSDALKGGEFAFTDKQLAAYGEHELQVLEDVLRSGTSEIQAAVAERIRRRIDWEKGPSETDRAFLEAFYRAQRKTLETRMLFGNRKRDKHDTD